ncbi:hypothetical protein [Oryzibacter oryziterrae]|uniref:hypothetical protein n=1 Tax=Oryzibacter oryziterrae TaxID=2766474 RepID=UPI001F367DB7|nr:hypothetical protein [Oryzibacter oryziterrae]
MRNPVCSFIAVLGVLGLTNGTALASANTNSSAAQMATAMGNATKAAVIEEGKTTLYNENGGSFHGWDWPTWGLAGYRKGVSSNPYFWAVGGGLTIKRGVAPSTAVTDLIRNPGRYGLDCSSAAVVMMQYGRLKTLGATDFNRLYPNNTFRVYGWTDPARYTRFSTVNTSRRFTWFNQISVTDKQGKIWRNLIGENMPFNPSKGDKLVIGGIYFFEKPGDVTSGNQGFNAVYMGRSGSDYQFFKSPGGVYTVTLDTAHNYLVTASNNDDLDATYLSSNITLPNGSLLKNQNRTAGD